MVMTKFWFSVIQVIAIMLIALVAGSTFGIWRGYAPEFYAASTFVEVHQGTVRGLNILLPLMAFGAIACVAALTYRARSSRSTLVLYVCALVLIVSAGLVTRLINQPINAEIMNWSITSLPVGWEAVRDKWWRWHIVRTLLSIAGTAVLIVAIFHDRNRA
jgi:uncharacterized membrane protein